MKSLINRRSVFLFLAICLAGLALVVTPERLASFGIMDSSLTSDNPLTRQSALRLILFARIGLAVCGMLLATLALAAPRIEASAFFQRCIREGSTFPEYYEQQQRRVFHGTALVALTSLVAASLYIWLGSRFGSQTQGLVSQEDGFIEWTSALLLLAACLTALRVASRMPDKAHAGMHLFLGVLFFVMLGEEISWGQRLLGFSTPDTLAQINVQGETNLHNSFRYLFDHLFILGFFVWGCVLPLLYWFEPVWCWVQSRLGIPIPSAGLSLAMLGITLFQEQVTDSLFGVIPGFRVPELRELLSALCFGLMMIESRALTADKS